MSHFVCHVHKVEIEFLDPLMNEFFYGGMYIGYHKGPGLSCPYLLKEWGYTKKFAPNKEEKLSKKGLKLLISFVVE